MAGVEFSSGIKERIAEMEARQATPEHKAMVRHAEKVEYALKIEAKVLQDLVESFDLQCEEKVKKQVSRIVIFQEAVGTMRQLVEMGVTLE